MVNPARRSTNSMRDPASYPQHIITFSKKKGPEALFSLLLVLDQQPLSIETLTIEPGVKVVLVFVSKTLRAPNGDPGAQNRRAKVCEALLLLFFIGLVVWCHLDLLPNHE